MCDNLTDVRDLMCNLELFLCDQKKLNSVLLFEINDIFRINNWKIVEIRCNSLASSPLRNIWNRKGRCYTLYQKSIEGGASCSIWRKNLWQIARYDMIYDSDYFLRTFLLWFVLVYSSDDCHGEPSNYVMISDIWKCELTRSIRWEKNKTEYAFVLFTAFSYYAVFVDWEWM